MQGVHHISVPGFLVTSDSHLEEEDQCKHLSIYMCIQLQIPLCSFGLKAKKTVFVHFSGVWIYELSVDLLHLGTNVCMCGSVACISGFHVHLWIRCIHVLEIIMLFSLNSCLINCKYELSGQTFT